MSRYVATIYAGDQITWPQPLLPIQPCIQHMAVTQRDHICFPGSLGSSALSLHGDARDSQHEDFADILRSSLSSNDGALITKAKA